MTANGVTLTFPTSTESPREARRGVVDALALEGDLAANVAILVSDAVTDRVLHDAEPIHVDARWTRECLRIEVGGERSAPPTARRDDVHGRTLIDRLAARWGLHADGHTGVWFEMAADRMN